MNDESRGLRYRLAALCERFNAMIADKDALDYRLGSREPYQDTLHGVSAEEAYEGASHAVSSDIRTIIVEMIEIGERIRAIEGF